MHEGELGVLGGLLHELAHCLGHAPRAALAAVLQVKLEAARRPEAEDRRRTEGEHQPFLDAAGLHEEVSDHLLGVDLALVPGLLRDEDRRGVVAEIAAEEIEAGEGDRVLVVRVRLDRLQHLRNHLVGALERRAIRKDHRAYVEALVLVGHQASRRELPQPDRDRHHAQKHQHADRGAADHPRHAVGVMDRDFQKSFVKPLEEAAGDLVLALEDQHAQRRRERERDDSRDHHRDRDRHRELAVELARQPAEEGDRHEHRAEHQHDRHHRPSHLAHRLDRRLARREVLLVHDALDVLEHHDGVVDHDADGEHHAEKRQRVDRVAEHVQSGEAADQRHRHRGDRDQGSAPVLQEQEHHQHHEQHRLAQREQHFADRHPHEPRRVVGHRIGHALRKARHDFVHGLHDAVGDLERVGARQQEDADQRRLPAVHAPDELVVLRGELDARHVLQAQVRAVGIGAQDDVLELLRVGEPALGGDGVDELLRARARRLSDLAGGELRVLLVQRADQIGGREAQLREAIGPHPDTHRVVLGAEDLHIRRSWDALQRVQDV